MKKIFTLALLALAGPAAAQQCGPLFPVNQVTSMSSIYAVNLECPPNVCPAGEFAGGIDQKGNAIDCATPAGGGVITQPTTFQSSVTFNASPLDAVFNFETDFQGFSIFFSTAQIEGQLLIAGNSNSNLVVGSSATFNGTTTLNGQTNIPGNLNISVPAGGVNQSNVEVLIASQDFVNASTVTFSNLLSSTTYHIFFTGVLDQNGYMTAFFNSFGPQDFSENVTPGQGLVGSRANNLYCGDLAYNAGPSQLLAGQPVGFDGTLSTMWGGEGILLRGQGQDTPSTPGSNDGVNAPLSVWSNSGVASLSSVSFMARTTYCNTQDSPSVTFSGHIEIWQGASFK